MRAGLLMGLGLLAILVGVLWTLQGLDVLGGSSMSGSAFWAVVGPLVIVAGAATAFVGWRRQDHS